MKITHHSIERYAHRIIGMDEISSESINQAQYDMIRNLLIEKLGHITIQNAVINYSDWDCRLVIVDNILVTITPR